MILQPLGRVNARVPAPGMFKLACGPNSPRSFIYLKARVKQHSCTMSFTITHPLGRPPTFPELQELARQHDVQINGGDQAGGFRHPQAEGNYAFEQNGNIRGDFTSRVIGKLSGTFVFAAGKAEVTITEKPFFVPDAVLKSKLSQELEAFCAKFPPRA
jgi:hypothetical protein